MPADAAAPTTLQPQHSQQQPVRVADAIRNPRQLKTEVLAGLVVALALIPEAISFSILAGVPPQMGLFASFAMAVTIAFVGGRPAMITAATGAVALVIAPLAHSHGVEYFVATVILAGILQIVLAFLGVAKLMRFIPRSVMTGFVNALAILIFMAQLPHLFGDGIPWIVYPLVAAGIAIIVLFPRLTSAIPSPLVAIALITAVVLATGWSMPNVSDQGELPTALPELFIPNVPLTLETLTVIGPYALAMALVGILESLMTAKLVDDITDTHSSKTRETWGQGIANMVAGFAGGMGGCAMIGQTMINVKQSGARTRISTFLAGVFLLILVIALGDIVGLIPMAALVAVMIMVSVGTMDWHSIRPSTLEFMPRSETVVMLVTVIATVLTHNLAIGVVLGVTTAMVAFARRVAHLVTIDPIWETDVDGDSTIDIRRYAVRGQLFFASSNDLVYQFDYAGDPDVVIIDLSDADVWDASTIATFDSVIDKYRERGKEARIIGLDGASQARLERLSGRVGAGH